MKILIFNWRDIKNPNAGGSEIYFHELAKRWVKWENEVTLICEEGDGCKNKETIDGIKIIRISDKAGLYLMAPIVYSKLKEKPDVIIDVENGIPFFTPFFAGAKKILHIHHVHDEVWFKELNFIFASIGWFLEKKVMPYVYRKVPVITLSESSKIDIKNKLKMKKVIGVVNPGIEFYPYKNVEKYKKPTILFLNRIKKYKGLDILLKAVREINKSQLNLDVLVAGTGDYLDKMKHYAAQNKLSNVKFLGRISEDKKKELMQKSWIFINPSFKEGWGIVNIEANYFGTPVIGSDVAGIKDSIVNNKTGLLFEYGNYKQLAEKIKYLIKNRKIRENMNKNSRIWAKKFDWDKKAEDYLNILKKIR